MIRPIFMLAALVGALFAALPATSSADRDDRREERKEREDERRERRKARKGDGEQSVRIPVTEGMRLDIEVTNGDIEIRAWDEVDVRVRTKSGDLSSVDIETSNEALQVRGSHLGVGWIRIPIAGGSVDLEIDVPRDLDVKARTVTGKIEAKDVAGRLELHAANGGIRVEGPVEQALLETMNADIEFEGEDSRVDARAVNGHIELSGVADEVIANTMTGSIEVEAGRVERVDLRTLSGPIELTATLEPDARVHLKTYNGDVRLEVPKNTSAEFDIQSFSGRIENALPTTEISTWRGGPGQRLDFVAGEGRGRVTVESFSGDVDIEDSD